MLPADDYCRGRTSRSATDARLGTPRAPSTGKCLGDFHGVTANFARIDLYACQNTNSQKWGRS